MSHYKLKRLKQDQLFYFHKLSPIQRDVCLGVLDGMSWAQAYRASQYATNNVAKEIDNIILWMQRNDDVNAFLNSVRDLSEELDQRLLRRSEALAILSNHARCNIADILEFKPVFKGMCPEGEGPVWETEISVKHPDLLGKEALSSISEIANTMHGVKVKQHSPKEAIAMIAKMQGWEADKKVDVNVKGNVGTRRLDEEEYANIRKQMLEEDDC